MPFSTNAPKAFLNCVDLFQQGKSIDQIWGGIFNVFGTLRALRTYPGGAYAYFSTTFSGKRSTLFGLHTALAAF
jgi:hypothetical protein